MIAALLGLFGSFKPPFWLVELCIGTMAIAATAWMSYHDGRNAQLVDDQASAAAQTAAYETQIDALQAKGEAVVAKKLSQDNQAEDAYRAIREEAPRVVTKLVFVPQACPTLTPPSQAPQSRFEAPVGGLGDEYSIGFVRVWNHALDPAAAVPDGAGGVATAASPGDPAAPPRDAQPSDVDQLDVLGNHIDNAERCAGIERQLNALIDWYGASVRKGNGK